MSGSVEFKVQLRQKLSYDITVFVKQLGTSNLAFFNVQVTVVKEYIFHKNQVVFSA